MNYEIIADVPVTELKNKSTNYLSSLGVNNIAELTGETVPVYIYITGSYDNPQVKTSVKKMARSIVGNMGVGEAFPLLIKEFYGTVESMTFIPEAEYKESYFYTNLIEILETIFNLARNETLTDNVFYQRIVDIFKKTKNEDLRFSLIKLLGYMGDQIDYFLEIYDDLTEKERRALYYVYTFGTNHHRLDIYKKGLGDEKNFEYVISNLLSFPEGRVFLSNEMVALSSYNKQTVLKKLLEGKFPEFNEVLIKILQDKNKFLVELAIDILKNNISSDFSMEPFKQIVETGYSPEAIEGALEIIDHFIKNQPEDIYLQGLDRQPSHKNKTVILDFLIGKLKGGIPLTEELTEKVVPKLLVYFDNHAKEKEELFLSIFKIIPTLRYGNSTGLKNIKKTVVQFMKTFDKRLSGPFRNNLGEFLVKVNHMIGRFEESEQKLKTIQNLFEIDPQKIDHDRLVKLKDQLKELDTLDDQTLGRLIEFLVTMYDVSKINWKIKALAIELLGDFGNLSVIPKLKEAAEKETSLAVKVNAQKAVNKLEERYAAAIQYVLIIEPLFYLQKKLCSFFSSKAFRVNCLKEIERFEEISKVPFRFLVISEALFNDEFTQTIFDYLDENLDAILIIVTARPEDMEAFNDIPNVRFLKKPFNDESLEDVIK